MAEDQSKRPGAISPRALRVPYGSKAGEDRVVARIRELNGQGLNMAKITALINTEFQPRTGKRFYPANVARILHKSLALKSKTTPTWGHPG